MADNAVNVLARCEALERRLQSVLDQIERGGWQTVRDIEVREWSEPSSEGQRRSVVPMRAVVMERRVLDSGLATRADVDALRRENRELRVHLSQLVELTATLATEHRDARTLALQADVRSKLAVENVIALSRA